MFTRRSKRVRCGLRRVICQRAFQFRPAHCRRKQHDITRAGPENAYTGAAAGKNICRVARLPTHVDFRTRASLRGRRAGVKRHSTRISKSLFRTALRGCPSPNSCERTSPASAARPALVISTRSIRQVDPSQDHSLFGSSRRIASSARRDGVEHTLMGECVASRQLDRPNPLKATTSKRPAATKLNRTQARHRRIHCNIRRVTVMTDKRSVAPPVARQVAARDEIFTETQRAERHQISVKSIRNARVYVGYVKFVKFGRNVRSPPLRRPRIRGSAPPTFD